MNFETWFEQNLHRIIKNKEFKEIIIKINNVYFDKNQEVNAGWIFYIKDIENHFWCKSGHLKHFSYYEIMEDLIKSILFGGELNHYSNIFNRKIYPAGRREEFTANKFNLDNWKNLKIVKEKKKDGNIILWME